MEIFGLGLLRIYTCILLVLINLLNFIDRFAVSPLAAQISDFYGVGYGQIGLLQTVFVIALLIFSPIFGHFGDRYSRKILISIGVILWSAAVIASTFVPKGHYWAFIVLRALVGIGEASYGTISPTILADFFVGNSRSRVLAVFFLAIPVGVGLGNVIGPNLAVALGSWQWGLRVTPIIGLVAAILFLFSEEAKRGEAELGISNKPTTIGQLDKTYKIFFQNLLALLKNKTFVCSSFASAAVLFSTGAFGWWAVTFLVYGQKNAGNFSYDASKAGIAFGILSAVGGLVGTILGSCCSQLGRKWTKTADCIVCGLSLLAGSLLMFAFATVADQKLSLSYPLMFFECVFVCFNWAVGPDILMLVVKPELRALATGLQSCIGHVLGDAISPYIVGATADALAAADKSDFGYFKAFQRAVYILPFFAVASAALYLIAANFVVRDMEIAASRDGVTAENDVDYAMENQIKESKTERL